MHISLAGISHNTAPLAVREQAAVPAMAVPRLAARFAAEWRGGGAVILATCARTEVYAAQADATAALTFFHTLFPALAPAHLYHAQDGAAAEHLFQVAAGLDSPQPGESEIAHQVRGAYAACRGAAPLPPELCRLFERALGTGRAVRAKLEKRRPPASLLTAAVDLAAQLTAGRPLAALVLGTGAAAQGLLAAIARHGAEATVVSRRHYARAGELAASFGFRAAPYEELPGRLRAAGCVFSATASPHTVIRPEHLTRRVDGTLLPVFDLALPRDVDPRVACLPGVRLLTLDDLRAPQVMPELNALRAEVSRRAARCLADMVAAA